MLPHIHTYAIIVFKAFTREGDQLFCQPTFRYYSSDTSSARCFLTSDVEREIVGHEKILVGLNQEVGIPVTGQKYDGCKGISAINSQGQW